MLAYEPKITEEDKQRYMKVLFALQESGELSLGHISDFLQVLPSAAARILKILHKENQLQVDKYQGTITLSCRVD